MFGLPASLGVDGFKPTASLTFGSVQHVTITIGSGATTNTATITSVNTATSSVIFQGWTAPQVADNQANTHHVRVDLTNATTVTATRNTSSTDSITVTAMVVNWGTLVNSIQQGTTTISLATSATTTITSVDTTKAAIFYLGESTTTTNTGGRYSCGAVLTNATTVTGNCENTEAAATVGWVVVEFVTAALASNVQKFTLTSTANTNVDTQTITSVTTSRSIVAYGGHLSSGSWSGEALRLSLASATSVTGTRDQTDTATRTVYFTVIEFASGILNSSVQRGTIDLTGAGVTSNTATITSVTTTKAIANFNAWSSDLANSSINTNCQKITLTNGTTVTGTVNTGNAGQRHVNYEVAEFV